MGSCKVHSAYVTISVMSHEVKSSYISLSEIQDFGMDVIKFGLRGGGKSIMNNLFIRCGEKEDQDMGKEVIDVNDVIPAVCGTCSLSPQPGAGQ